MQPDTFVKKTKVRGGKMEPSPETFVKTQRSENRNWSHHLRHSSKPKVREQKMEPSPETFIKTQRSEEGKWSHHLRHSSKPKGQRTENGAIT